MSERDALCEGVSAMRLKLRGFRMAGHSRRRKIKPLTTRVRTSRSWGHRDITFLCKQLHMYRIVLNKRKKKALILVKDCDEFDDELRTGFGWHQDLLGNFIQNLQKELCIRTSITTGIHFGRIQLEKKNSYKISSRNWILSQITSQDCLASINLWIVSLTAAVKNGVQIDFM